MKNDGMLTNGTKKKRYHHISIIYISKTIH